MRKAVIYAALLAAYLPLTAWSAELNDNTSCAVIARAYDRVNEAMEHHANVDQLKQSTEGDTVIKMGDYVKATMEDMDQKHTDNGEPGIIAGLSDGGMQDLIAMVAAHCQTHHKATLYNSTAFVYRGTRELEKSFGVAK